MRIENARIVLGVLWAVGLCVMGVFSGMGSLTAWLALTAVALLPPVVMLRLWRVPSPSLSEAIHDARQ
jgi:uncharacterized membrane protein